MPPLPWRSRRTAVTSRRAVSAIRSRAVGRDVGRGQDLGVGRSLVEPGMTADRGAQRRGRRWRGGEDEIHGGAFREHRAIVPREGVPSLPARDA